MRIAIVHSFYRCDQPSGENLAAVEQASALAEAGHDVRLFTRSTDVEQHRLLYAARAGVRVATGRGDNPAAAIADFAPDVVHLHNLFPNIGTHWLADWPGPVVATAHNFRYGCANGLLFRDGALCTLCPDGDRLAAVRHGCYHGSAIATVPLALANRHGAAGHAVVRRADRLVVLSGRSRDLFAGFGVPADRLALVPNFVRPCDGGDPADEPGDGPTPEPDPGPARFAAAGRLVPEKGFADLLAQWPAGPRLDVAGSGPQAADLQSLAGPGVRLLGTVPNGEWRGRLGRYTALVLPSTWSEGGIPIALLEAWAAGVPVVARRGNAGADAVEQSGAGATYADATGLAHALDTVTRDRAALGRAAQAAYRAHHTPQAWTAAMTAVYRSVVR